MGWQDVGDNNEGDEDKELGRGLELGLEHLHSGERVPQLLLLLLHLLQLQPGGGGGVLLLEVGHHSGDLGREKSRLHDDGERNYGGEDKKSDPGESSLEDVVDGVEFEDAIVVVDLHAVHHGDAGGDNRDAVVDHQRLDGSVVDEIPPV